VAKTELSISEVFIAILKHKNIRIIMNVKANNVLNDEYNFIKKSFK
jgi:hypothetical protein